MGAKISVDSATLMNKGLELIEAHYLVRPALGADRCRDPSAVGRSFDGRVRRRLGAGAARQPRHAHPDRLCAGLAGADGDPRAAAGPRRRSRDSISSNPTSSAFPRFASPEKRSRRAAPRRSCSTPPTRSPSRASLRERSAFPKSPHVVQEALNGADYDAPRSIGDVLEIDRVTREQAESMMKASCS